MKNFFLYPSRSVFMMTITICLKHVSWNSLKYFYLYMNNYSDHKNQHKIKETMPPFPDYAPFK